MQIENGKVYVNGRGDVRWMSACLEYSSISTAEFTGRMADNGTMLKAARQI